MDTTERHFHGTWHREDYLLDLINNIISKWADIRLQSTAARHLCHESRLIEERIRGRDRNLITCIA